MGVTCLGDNLEGRGVGGVVEELPDGPLPRRGRGHLPPRPVHHPRRRVLRGDLELQPVPKVAT